MSLTEITRYLNMKDPKYVWRTYLYDLERASKKYFIPDAADAILKRSCSGGEETSRIPNKNWIYGLQTALDGGADVGESDHLSGKITETFVFQKGKR